MVAGDSRASSRIVDNTAHPALATFLEHFHGAVAMGLQFVLTPPFYPRSGRCGVCVVLLVNVREHPAAIQRRFSAIHTLFENKYYFDKINEFVFRWWCSRLRGKGFWRGGDLAIIDGLMIVDGYGQAGWLVCHRNPLLPDRLRLSLRFHHDHRRVCADDPVINRA